MLDSKTQMILQLLQDNLARQDELNRKILRLRARELHASAAVLTDSLVGVISEQGALVTQLKMYGVDENYLRSLLC